MQHSIDDSSSGVSSATLVNKFGKRRAWVKKNSSRVLLNGPHTSKLILLFRVALHMLTSPQDAFEMC